MDIKRATKKDIVKCEDTFSTKNRAVITTARPKSLEVTILLKEGLSLRHPDCPGLYRSFNSPL